MIENNLVSTIIPVYNRSAMLIEAVESVMQQTYRPIEIIIVDDGSTDDTPNTIEDLVGQYPGQIMTIRTNNNGPGAAREAGRLIARGAFIQYLDSDDLLVAGKFMTQVQALNKNPDCGIAYGKTYHSGVGDALRPVPFKESGVSRDYLFPALLRSRWWSTSTPLYTRAVTDSIGPWLSLSSEEDWEYEARAGSLGVRLCYCDCFVSVTRWHDDRLHTDGSTDPEKLRDRATAHNRIFHHALRAGIKTDGPEMGRFSRELFLLARQCGAAGLKRESRELFATARTASGPVRAGNWDFRAYQTCANLLGWERAGKLSCWLDQYRARS